MKVGIMVLIAAALIFVAWVLLRPAAQPVDPLAALLNKFENWGKNAGRGLAQAPAATAHLPTAAAAVPQDAAGFIARNVVSFL